MTYVFSFKYAFDCPVDRFVSCHVRPMENISKGKFGYPSASTIAVFS